MQIEYRLRDTVDLYEFEDTTALVSMTDGKSLKFPKNATAMSKALQSAWMTEDEAIGLTDDLAQGYYAIITMQKTEMLKARIRKNDATAFALSPAPTDSAFKGTIDSSTTYRLNRFAYLRQTGGNMLLESPLTPCRITLVDTKLGGILNQLYSGLRVDIADDVTKSFLSALITLGIVESSDTRNENDPMDLWEFHDLLFHARSLHGKHAYAAGGTYHFHGKRPTLPAIKESVSKDFIPLPKPSVELTDRLNSPFSDVLNKRESHRELSGTALTVEELGAFLYASAMVKRTMADPDHDEELTSRPSPSGGARHPLEIYPFIRQCEGVDPGAYRYDPKVHRLERIPMDPALFEQLMDYNPFESLGGKAPQVILNIAARIGRTSWKYESIAYKIINQDMGCMYQTFYLVATALGLAPCAFGSVNTAQLGKAHSIDWREEPFIGSFALGK